MRTGPELDHDTDEGFTLVEMIVVIAIVGLIMGTLVLTVTTFLRNEGSVSARITETRDLQNLTNFLPRDVASARSISQIPATPADGCGSGGTPVLHMEWAEEWRGTLYSQRVTYREFTTPSQRLTRFECENGNPAAEFTVADVYESLTIECDAPTVFATLTFPGGTRTITATSRNFLPASTSC